MVAVWRFTCDALEELVFAWTGPNARSGGVECSPTPPYVIRAAREVLARARVGTPGEVAPTRPRLRPVKRWRPGWRSDAPRFSRLPPIGRQLFSAVLTAPEPVRARLRGLKAKALITKALLALRPNAAWAGVDVETATVVTCLQIWARRIQTLTAEAEIHEREIRTLVRSWRPELLEEPGIGPIVAATVLCAWGYAGRIHSEAAFAKLAGTSPVEANSGQINTRHRLNRYGDRRLNCALHTVVITRQRRDPATRAYTERRTTNGKNPREIRRCLKRYVARDLYRLLEAGSGVDVA